MKAARCFYPGIHYPSFFFIFILGLTFFLLPF